MKTIYIINIVGIIIVFLLLVFCIVKCAIAAKRGYGNSEAWFYASMFATFGCCIWTSVFISYVKQEKEESQY